ncbi:hypothetical protein [Desulfopila sp. IMCC35006]|nr:hypothetical protein [Desulfopila sp. IMCC35006]
MKDIRKSMAMPGTSGHFIFFIGPEKTGLQIGADELAGDNNGSCPGGG